MDHFIPEPSIFGLIFLGMVGVALFILAFRLGKGDITDDYNDDGTPKEDNENKDNYTGGSSGSAMA